MSTPGIRKLTYADYAQIPDDGKRHEILGGEEIVTPSPDVAHQRASVKLSTLLDRHVTEHGLGEVLTAPMDVVLGVSDIVQPDLLFVSRERSAIVGEMNVQGAPDLVVEISSPSTRALDRTRKLEAYATAGVRECWIVDRAERLVEVHRVGATRERAVVGAGGILRSELLPGLEIRVADILG